MVDKETAKKCVELVQKSKEVVKEAFEKFDPASCAITWTGGKDSTLQLWIIRQVCVEYNIDLPKVMTIDEGDAFSEIHTYVLYELLAQSPVHFMGKDLRVFIDEQDFPDGAVHDVQRAVETDT